MKAKDLILRKQNISTKKTNLSNKAVHKPTKMHLKRSRLVMQYSRTLSPAFSSINSSKSAVWSVEPADPILNGATFLWSLPSRRAYFPEQCPMQFWLR